MGYGRESEIHKRGQFQKTSPIERGWSYLKWFIRRTYHHIHGRRLSLFLWEIEWRFSAPETFTLWGDPRCWKQQPRSFMLSPYATETPSHRSGGESGHPLRRVGEERVPVKQAAAGIIRAPKPVVGEPYPFPTRKLGVRIVRFSEYHSGYMRYSRQALERIPFHRLPDTFHFNGEMLKAGAKLGVSVCERPIPTTYQDEKSHLKPIPYGFAVLRMLWDYTQGKYRFDDTMSHCP